MPLAVFLPRVQVKMQCFTTLKPVSLRQKTHSLILEYSNAFLSGSICGGSAPLVSLSISTSFLKTAGYKTEQDITFTTQAPAC